MKRKLFSATCCLVFLTCAAFAQKPASSTSVPAYSIPAWVDCQIDEACARLQSWRGQDATVVFPVVTDIHEARPFFRSPPDFRDKKYHILFAQRAALRCAADFMADLGDIGFDRDLSWKPSSQENAQKRLESQRNLYQSFPLPVLFCMGNHDSGRAYGGVFSECKLSSQDYGVMFNGMIKKRGVKLVTGPHEDYGYYDVPDKKCRVFFLNTSDSYERGFSLEQMQFLADHLKMPQGYCAVILEHVCIHPTIGKWKPVGTSTIKNGDLCFEIFAGFLKHSRGEAQNVHWDFTANQETSLAGCISGDSHFNRQAVYGGVHYVITQGYGTIAAKKLPEGADHVTPVDYRKTMLVDVVAVKPAKKQMKIFRVGAGGPARDRSFDF